MRVIYAARHRDILVWIGRTLAAFHAADEQAERKVIALGSRTIQAQAKQARSSTANG